MSYYSKKWRRSRRKFAGLYNYRLLYRMSTVEALNPRPVRVSPLIKFSRWSLLIVGVMYGVYHQRRFEKKEAVRREIEEKERPIREAKLAEEKRIAQEAEIKMLNELLGVKQ